MAYDLADRDEGYESYKIRIVMHIGEESFELGSAQHVVDVPPLLRDLAELEEWKI